MITCGLKIDNQLSMRVSVTITRIKSGWEDMVNKIDVQGWDCCSILSRQKKAIVGSGKVLLVQ